LREDPDLAATLPAELRDAALERCVAGTITLPAGPWAACDMAVLDDGLGLLVLDGVLVRRVGVEGRFGAEILGAGDILRPWEGEDLDSALATTSGWRVLERARVAVLDGRVAARMAPFPALTAALLARAVLRSRYLALMMAIVHQPRTHLRVRMLLWVLADRWGRVRPDGVFVPLRLTHTVIAELIAARRPSVTLALGKLVEEGHVESAEGGWLLHGDPPGELLELGSVGIASE
jgi:CRP-like cAMP-binding protein